MTASEFGSFVLAFLVALILFFGGQRALVELTDNEDFALPVQVTVDEPDTSRVPSAPSLPPDVTVPPEDVPGPSGEPEAEIP